MPPAPPNVVTPTLMKGWGWHSTPILGGRALNPNRWGPLSTLALGSSGPLRHSTLLCSNHHLLLIVFPIWEVLVKTLFSRKCWCDVWSTYFTYWGYQHKNSEIIMEPQRYRHFRTYLKNHLYKFAGFWVWKQSINVWKNLWKCSWKPWTARENRKICKWMVVSFRGRTEKKAKSTVSRTLYFPREKHSPSCGCQWLSVTLPWI